METHKSDRCSGPLQAGGKVCVFSRHADQWADGVVMESVKGNLIRVEYEVGDDYFGKMMDVHSKDLSSFSVRGPGGQLIPLGGVHHAREYYVEMNLIYKALEKGDVLLVKGSWLLSWNANHPTEALPRRQDLPEEAVCNISEVRSGAQIVAISHCWLTELHPDPSSSQLRELCPFIGSFMNAIEADKYFQTGCVREAEVAFFFDWCSLYQQPRTYQEEARFKNSLATVDLWYGHANIHVWMLTSVPSNADNPTSYDDRGWTSWERKVASILSGPTKKVLDFAAYPVERLENSGVDFRGCHDPDEVHEFYWDCRFSWREEVQQACEKCDLVPLTPPAFDSFIRLKCFTKGNMDYELLNFNYRQAFKHIMKCHTDDLHYGNVRWGKEEAQVLGDTFEYMPSVRALTIKFVSGVIAESFSAMALRGLRHLCVYMHVDGNLGARALGQVLPYFAHLRYLEVEAWENWSFVVGSSISDISGMDDTNAILFAKALPCCHDLEEVTLGGHNIGDVGAEALAESSPDCPKLEKFGLWIIQPCPCDQVARSQLETFGDEGAMSFAVAFPCCPKLRKVTLQSWAVGSDGLQALKDMQKFIGNPR